MMGLYKPDFDFKDKTPARYRFRVVGYRTYANADKVGFADENCQRFRRLLLQLKEGDQFAIELFAALLATLFYEVLGAPEAILCVPSSCESGPRRDDPLSQIVRMACAMGIDTQDGSSWLRRTETVPKAHVPGSGMRSVEKQMESIAFMVPRGVAIPRSVVVIDDIYTSGSTMMASVARVREQCPQAEVSGFAFGRTRGFVPEKSPRVPAFPRPNQSPDLVDVIADQWREEAWPLPLAANQSPFVAAEGVVHQYWCRRVTGENEPLWSKTDADAEFLEPCAACKPFAEKPVFVLNEYSRTIHHIDCRTGPSGNGKIDLWSLREGIRLGGHPCVNCMHRWPVAKELFDKVKTQRTWADLL